MIRAGLAVARHPSLWSVALRQARRLAAPGWWHRWPFLPRPPRDYLQFRTTTQYGGATSHRPAADDVLNYLAWCRDWDR